MNQKSIPDFGGKVIAFPRPSNLFQQCPIQLAIPSRGKVDIIRTDQILFLKAVSNYTEIHMADGQLFFTSFTLKRYCQKLIEPEFLRIHSSYLVRSSALKTYIANDNKFILVNDQEIPIARSRKEQVLAHLKKLMV